MADPRLGPASHPRPEKPRVMMPSAKMGSMGTLLSSTSKFMFTSSMAPPVPPMAMVTMLLASWILRRVFRSWKKWFQSRLELVAVVVEPDVELDVDAVLALRRAVNWYGRDVDVGFRGVLFWKAMLVEICLDVTRTAHGCRASDSRDAECCGRCAAAREKAIWKVVWRGSVRLLPRVTKRAAAAAVVGVNIVSFVVSVQFGDLPIE